MNIESMAMQPKYTTISLIVLVALAITITGSIGSAADSGHCIGLNASTVHLLNIYPPGGASGQMATYSLPVNNLFVALAAGVEGPAFSSSYVSRARNSQNENRDAILKLIAENPGLQSRDISKISGINFGTVRYHLMILGINHLVTEYRDGVRQVRYFTNNGAYDKDQMMVISLLRREPMGRLIGALAGNEGMSNSRISAASGLSYSEVNRYLNELMARGIVTKESLSMRKSLYRIAPGLEDIVIKAAGRKN